MATLLETIAGKFHWRVLRANVIVEGTTDVALLEHAEELYFKKYGVRLLGNECSVLAAGYGDDGGVEGVNRKLTLMRQMAEADADHNGRIRNRFIGLYDNDLAGRRAVQMITNFDRRIRRCRDVFLLHPVMPLKRGVDPKTLEDRFDKENAPYRTLDWEIEDLISTDFYRAFESDYPTAIAGHMRLADKIHRNITSDGKRNLLSFIRSYAALEDMLDVVKLLRALRDYLHLQSDHIVVD